ncbi:MAG: adenylate/guanylate cyclase domain-containing protein [Deltaproteobacteria bacterium]|nr:adenylate/guanylate cyclase domain-containing protein [Deltaproteobacteria bacterium]
MATPSAERQRGETAPRPTARKGIGAAISTYPWQPGPASRAMTLMQIAGHVWGAAQCTFYFLYLDPIDQQPVWDSSLYVALVMTAGLVLLGLAVGIPWQRDLRQAGLDLEAGRELSPARLDQARRKVLNGPWFFAYMSLFNWGMAAVIMSGHRLWFHATAQDPHEVYMAALRLFAGVGAAGIVTTAIVFLSMEAAFRKWWPLFFPEGGLVGFPGAHRLPLRRRLLYSFLLVTLLPTGLGGLLLYHKLFGATALDLEQTRLGILYSLGFVAAALLLASLELSHLASQSISLPVEAMAQGMDRVREGDFSGRVDIPGNDELGQLAESFNDMTAGLEEREAMREIFGKYVSRQVRDEILAGRVTLEGEMKFVTLLFSDLRDFTTLAEAYPGREVVRLINGYFARMAEAIEENGGLILQFVGDEIEAVFGAPVDQEFHALRAVEAAWGMQERLAAYNRELARQGLPTLRHGIGLHTGPVLAAGIGGPRRLSYALVGDTVNLASRVEGLTKQLGQELLASEATLTALGSHEGWQNLGPQPVKGREQPVVVYAPAV